MRVKEYKDMQNYWNDKEIVSFFSNSKPSEYWEKFFSKIDNKSNIKVLDLGCGGGRNMVMLLGMGFEVEGCDLHIEMVNITREKIKKFNGSRAANEIVVKANAMKLPYKNCSFNIVLANGVYHNLNNKNEFCIAINETSRVLKSNGLLCLNMFSNETIDENLEPTEIQGKYISPNKINMFLISSEEIVNILKENKLELISDISVYEVEVFTGKRSVTRGVFIKR